MESHKQNNNDVEGEKVEEIGQGRFNSAMAEIEDADRLLLEGLDPEKEGLGHIRESLMRISEPLFSTLLKKVRDESDSTENRFKYVRNLSRLKLILGEKIFADLLRDNLTSEETVIELESKLSKNRGFLKRLLR